MHSPFFATLSLALLASLPLACGAGPSTENEPGQKDQAAAAAGRVGTHGMVLFGQKSKAYLSHIPTFDAPHDVQLVAEAKLEGAGADLLGDDLSDRLYTLAPSRFSLDALRSGALTSFQGTVYRGNFEQGGTPLAANVRVQVSRIVHEHVLAANAPATAENRLVVGTADKAFVIQRIDGAPGVDRIVTIALGTRRPSDAELLHGKFVAEGTFDVESPRLLSCLEGPDFASACP